MVKKWHISNPSHLHSQTLIRVSCTLGSRWRTNAKRNRLCHYIHAAYSLMGGVRCRKIACYYLRNRLNVLIALTLHTNTTGAQRSEWMIIAKRKQEKNPVGALQDE